MPAQKTLTACWGLTAGATPSALIDRHVLKRATWNVARGAATRALQSAPGSSWPPADSRQAATADRQHRRQVPCTARHTRSLPSLLADVRAKSVLLDGEGCIVAATLNAQGIGTLVQDGAIDAVPAAFGLLPRQLPPGKPAGSVSHCLQSLRGELTKYPLCVHNHHFSTQCMPVTQHPRKPLPPLQHPPVTQHPRTQPSCRHPADGKPAGDDEHGRNA